MGWKEMWEKYQVAATFAEAGEHETARRVLEEGSKEHSSPSQENRPAEDHDKTSPVHQVWKTGSAHGFGS